MIARSILAIFISAACLSAHILPAKAQMQLPGAFTPAPVGTVVTTAPQQKPKKKVEPFILKPPPETAVLNRTIMHNGKAGALEFRLDGKDLAIARFKVTGSQIARPDAACEVEPTPPMLKAAGKPNGALRYTFDAEGCALSLDLLDGAALVSTSGGACEIKSAACKVDPNGLWGQPASEIGPQRTKEIERSRAGAEHSAREQFKEWLAAVKGDRVMIARIARDQAAFSSKREEICHTYAREGEHGYCALIVTQARALALSSRVPPPELPPEPAPKKKR